MNTRLIKTVIRVPQKDSAFIYFILEAHDNLCSFSTVNINKEDPYRDIEITATKDFEEELIHVLNRLKQDIHITEIIPLKLLSS